ncbi:peroxiredoxin [Rhodoblastus acidophilus]|uniref:thioredoxin-dependent peroxiredoxin n=1 Tax=Candidatus Rhodoblastus alkanivorans TaxID=2954117 RepID=A0ABS9ZA95_9HYPH|nr:peroxiredoxin [Candidatus Rhodoblastus alkanivorans]MCI4677175.1 peroxiredoxin [Candidatus Rhodoblastus alkanivorans]MCI4684528.1 peroxiredoxin [Candidatus Rhodoblastus alkanivorans]MDI4641849.1 peroxiredoxin [Rhodoblastus acidophilus]
MKRLAAGILFVFICSTASWAAMKVGDIAPVFTLEAALGGKTFTFNLAEALKKGPVVLYFYPKSFTPGCTIEAHEFAENAASFAAVGATLIGVSNDTIATQIEFSSRECRDKFPVGADADGKVIRAYDSQMLKLGGLGPMMASRVSYVIAPDDRIIYAFQDSSPHKHISNTLAVVRQWRADHPR